MADSATDQVGAQRRFVRVDISDHIATVSLNRPRVNALNPTMMREITCVFKELGRGSKATVAILTSAQRRCVLCRCRHRRSERRYVRRELAEGESDGT